MIIRILTTFAAATLVAGAFGCASTPDNSADSDRRPREYRTGSNIAIHDGDMARGEKTVKPDAVPILRGPGPMVGPTGGSGG
jgi:hypothetical protein